MRISYGTAITNNVSPLGLPLPDPPEAEGSRNDLGNRGTRTKAGGNWATDSLFIEPTGGQRYDITARRQGIVGPPDYTT